MALEEEVGELFFSFFFVFFSFVVIVNLHHHQNQKRPPRKTSSSPLACAPSYSLSLSLPTLFELKEKMVGGFAREGKAGKRGRSLF